MTSDPATLLNLSASNGELERLRAENAALKAELEQLKTLNDHDVLVPLLNRRAFERELGRTLNYCKRYEASAAVVFVDLDGFKAVNDRFGHMVGDAALRRVAEILSANVRESDVVARIGGDEFAILLQQADRVSGEAKAASLMTLIRTESFTAEGERVPLGGSAGVRAYEGQESAEQWLAEADAAMFVRKRAPR